MSDFEFSEAEQVPRELQEHLRRTQRKSTAAALVLEAFSIKSPLDLNNLVTFAYKRHKKIVKRATIRSAVKSLCDSGALEQVSRGKWRLPKSKQGKRSSDPEDKEKSPSENACAECGTDIDRSENVSSSLKYDGKEFCSGGCVLKYKRGIAE